MGMDNEHGRRAVGNLVRDLTANKWGDVKHADLTKFDMSKGTLQNVIYGKRTQQWQWRRCETALDLPQGMLLLVSNLDGEGVERLDIDKGLRELALSWIRDAGESTRRAETG